MQSSSQYNRDELRAGLKQLAEEAHNKKETLCSASDAGELNRLISKQNDFNASIEKPREEVVDAEAFAFLAACATEATKKMAHGGQGRSAIDLITALRYSYVHSSNPQNDGRDDAEAMSWAEAGEAASRLFLDAPRFFCMLGPMDVQLKVRKPQKAREARKPLGAVTRPDELASVDEKEDKQETDRLMEEMWTKLQEHKQAPVPELVCNHESFNQTIENLFTLSFLVRDQKVRLCRDERLGMMAVAVTEKPAAGNRGAAAEQSQFVIDLCQSDWEVMRTMVAPQDCVMSKRSHQQDGPAAKRRRPS